MPNLIESKLYTKEPFFMTLGGRVKEGFTYNQGAYFFTVTGSL